MSIPWETLVELDFIDNLTTVIYLANLHYFRKKSGENCDIPSYNSCYLYLLGYYKRANLEIMKVLVEFNKLMECIVNHTYI